MLLEVPITQSKTKVDGVIILPFPLKKCDAAIRLLDGAPCSARTSRIRQGARRLACWSCKAQCHFFCVMSSRTQIVRTLATRRWQCTHCSQKPAADSHDNQMAPVLDKKKPWCTTIPTSHSSMEHQRYP